MDGSFKIGRILGIPITLHYSWILIAALITFSLAGRFAVMHPEWSGSVIWLSALVTSALFFLTLVLHEVSHAVVARASGLPVDSIMLFALGGIARIRRDASSPGVEFRVAIVGPLTSAAIGLLCYLGAGALAAQPAIAGTPPVEILAWLGYINFVLAVFNMLPAFPLDGGRVLRALLWRWTGNVQRATRMAARAGQVLAVALMAFGFLLVLRYGDFGGLWLAVLGWFILQAAAASQLQTAALEELRGIRVADVMARDCATVDPDMPLSNFVEQVLLRSGARCFVAAHDGRLDGLITPADLRAVERTRWPVLTVGDVMRPAGTLRSVGPSASAADAFEMMAQEDLNQLPVVEGDHVEGVVSRGDILRVLQRRGELAA